MGKPGDDACGWTRPEVRPATERRRGL